MRRQQREYLLYLRLRLGRSMRTAHDQIGPLTALLEQGYRWETDEIKAALRASADLADSARNVADHLEEFVERYRGSLTPAEKGRLAGGKKYGKGAVGGMRRGAQFLDEIDAEEIAKLEDEWLAGKEEKLSDGHEAHFLRRYAGAMKLLRMSWNAMFYASEKPTPRRIKLDERESSGYYNPMAPGIARKIREDADKLAEQSGDYVEVYDADNDLVYVAVPPTTMAKAELDRARQRARPRGKKVKQAIANMSDDKQDVSLLVEMWQWDLGA